MLFVFYYLAIWNLLLFKYLWNKVIEFCYANLNTPVNYMLKIMGGLVMSSVQIFLVYSVVLFAEFFYSGPSCSKAG